MHSLAAFLGSRGSVTSPSAARRNVSALMGSGLTYAPAYTLAPGQPSPGFTYLSASPHRSPPLGGSVPVGPEGPTIPLATAVRRWSRNLWYRNINRLCIDYASRPRLSSRLTLGGLSLPRNPWTSGGGVSHPSLATYTYILTRAWSTTVSTGASLRTRRSATTPAKQESATSASDLSPVTFSARDHLTSELLRTLSMVAASKPTSWLSGQSHFVFHLVRTLGP